MPAGSSPETLDPRIEAAARAMARCRLSTHSFSRSLGSETIRELLQAAEDRVWPTLIEEAKAALEAADAVAHHRGHWPWRERSEAEIASKPGSANDAADGGAAT